MAKFKSIQKEAVTIAVVSLLVVIVSIACYIYWQSGQIKSIAEMAKKDREQMSERIWKAKSENYSNIVRDNSAWDDLVNFIDNNSDDTDSTWLEDNFGYMVDAYNASMVALYDNNGNVLYQKRDELPLDPNQKFDFEDVRQNFCDTGLCSFYIYTGDGLTEYFAATVTTTSDNNHRLPAKGYLFLSRRITDEVIEDYRKSLGAVRTELSIAGNDVKHTDSAFSNGIVVSNSLKNYQQHTEAEMYSVFENSIMDFFDDIIPAFLVMALLFLGILVSILLFIQKKVSKPLKKISKALIESDAEPISEIIDTPNEFGQIAEMIDAFFFQRDELQEQNVQLTQQRNTISEQKREIEQSITYAQRIQRALLTPDETINSVFPEHFLLYKPRNIVSGDYYWINEFGDNKVCIVADCTGHGVPGGFMSMLGITNLNYIVGQELQPDQILNNLREAIITELRQREDYEQRTTKIHCQDGMDVAVYVVNTATMKLSYAGAHNPLVLIRDNDVQLFKADKMPVGVHSVLDPFTRHDIDLKPGDCIYTFSDGFQDQFGIESGRKFMGKRLRTLLLEIHSQPMAEQRRILEETFEHWRGPEEKQTDDVVVFGVRI